jgi:hypothetical protein
MARDYRYGAVFIVVWPIFRANDKRPTRFSGCPETVVALVSCVFLFRLFYQYHFGLYYVEPNKRRWYFNASQSLMIASPFLLAYGFMFESFDMPDIDRAIGIQGAIIFSRG